jgi:alpha-L-rhamnosidase
MSAKTIFHLTCEYRTNPLGIDVHQPRLSWQMQSDQRGARQTAYQILAAPTEASLEAGSDLLWNSGKVESEQSIHAPYRGSALVSGQRVYWKVRVWDEAGKEFESAPAWWEMGLLERTDWKAQWIAAPFWGGPRTSSPAPFLRKEFTLQKQFIAARLYVTALGLYECHLNGVRVGEALLTPGWTDYFRRIQYQVYDVTKLLRSGTNAFGAILGDGWGVGHIAWLGRQHYADRPQLLAQIVVTHADDSQEIIATDQDWKVTQGPILEADMLMGESYDARRELLNWSKPGYDDVSWRPVEIFTDSGASLVATNGPAVKRQESLRPVSIHIIPALRPRWVFDMGQNMVGWVRLAVRGEKGTTITIRYAEALNPDGSLYTTNLRTARSTDHYTLKGGDDETWEPRFTFHGFRYVEVAGLPDTPTETTLTGIVIHSEMPQIGAFECSDPLINQLQHNIVWGQKGNFVDIPTDCPQRDERLGWTGDAQVFIRTAAFNQDVAGFFTKWTCDLEDAQSPEGAYPLVAPNLMAWSIGADGGPAWADAGVICPWTIYQCYGDIRLLEEHYVSMQRFIDFLSQTSRNGLRCYPEYPGKHGHGDWLALDGSDGREGGTSKELIGTAFFAYSSGLLARIARILDRAEDALYYEALSNEAREAFIKRFVHANGTIEGGTQTSYVLALEFDLLPPEFRPLAAAELVGNIRGRNNHLSTGFVGTPYINWVLSKTGHLETAYALLKQTTWPSWLYSVTQGATTIWERWDGWTHDKGFQDPNMNSFNHYAYGAIGAWMYTVIGGIDLDPDQPGYKHIIMHPRPGGGLTYATTEQDSMYGRIRSAWTQDDDCFNWQVTIPANTTATISIPAKKASLVTESGQPLENAIGVTFLHMEHDVAVLRLVSGRYNFSSSME